MVVIYDVVGLSVLLSSSLSEELVFNTVVLLLYRSIVSASDNVSEFVGDC